MINFSFGPNIFLGIIVSFGVLILYFLRNIKPEVARDEDIFFRNNWFTLQLYFNGSWMEIRSNSIIQSSTYYCNSIGCWLGKYSITRFNCQHGKIQKKEK